jgi:response regulator RpfG family c-di-GMP phosphodiesterase
VQVDKRINLLALLKMVVQVAAHLGLQVLLQEPELLDKDLAAARKMMEVQDRSLAAVAGEVQQQDRADHLAPVHLVHIVELLQFMLQVVMVKELQTLSTQTWLEVRTQETVAMAQRMEQVLHLLAPVVRVSSYSVILIVMQQQ